MISPEHIERARALHATIMNLYFAETIAPQIVNTIAAEFARVEAEAVARSEARVAELVAAAKQVGGQEIVFEGCRCVAIPIEAQEAIDAALTGNGAAAAAVIAATEPGEAKP